MNIDLEGLVYILRMYNGKCQDCFYVKWEYRSPVQDYIRHGKRIIILHRIEPNLHGLDPSRLLLYVSSSWPWSSLDINVAVVVVVVVVVLLLLLLLIIIIIIITSINIITSFLSSLPSPIVINNNISIIIRININSLIILILGLLNIWKHLPNCSQHWSLIFGVLNSIG